MPVKTLDQFFRDWESHCFGYGYGTGEEHTLGALVDFFNAMPIEGGYDYRELEKACGTRVAWLLINTLCHAGVIEYGTSPRCGWLTENGNTLAEYVRKRTLAQLIVATDHDESYTECFPDYCNCVGGKSEGCCALNPFWPKQR